MGDLRRGNIRYASAPPMVKERTSVTNGMFYMQLESGVILLCACTTVYRYKNLIINCMDI